MAAAVGGMGVVCATLAFGHPSPESREARALCARTVPSKARLDPVDLGQSEGSLREAFGRALTGEPQCGSSRLWRTHFGDDVAVFEYDLHAGRVYRIRWRLAERFEVPALDVLLARGRVCFGPPAYDQTLEPKVGHPRPVVRRIGWRHGGRRVELRQVNPLTGGPVYLSIADETALEAANKAGAEPPVASTPAGSWWRQPRRTRIPGKAERRALGDAFGVLLAELDH